MGNPCLVWENIFPSTTCRQLCPFTLGQNELKRSSHKKARPLHLRFFSHSWSPLGWCKTIIFISNVIFFLLVGRTFSWAVFQHFYFFYFFNANISRTGLFLGIHLGPAWNFSVLTCRGLNSILFCFSCPALFQKKSENFATIINVKKGNEKLSKTETHSIYLKHIQACTY